MASVSRIVASVRSPALDISKVVEKYQKAIKFSISYKTILNMLYNGKIRANL